MTFVAPLTVLAVKMVRRPKGLEREREREREREKVSVGQKWDS